MNLEEELREAEVFKWVQELWPTCRMTEPEFHHAAWWKLRHYPSDTIRQALQKHRQAKPDRTRPLWDMLFHALPKSASTRGNSNPLQLLLWQLRRLWAKGDKESRIAAEHATDEEVWNTDVWGQVASWTHQWKPIGDGKMGWVARDDADGRRAKAAADQRSRIARSMIRELEDGGHPVPDYLKN